MRQMDCLTVAGIFGLSIRPGKFALVLLALLVGIVVTLILTPLAISLARKAGVVDHPNDERRVHTTPTPRWGGLAMYAAFLLTVLLEMGLWHHLINRRVIGILIGGLLITTLGALDDKFNVPAKLKLVGQILAAIVLTLPIFGVRLVAMGHGPGVPLFATPVFFDRNLTPLLGSILTVIWVVAITNAVNLMDGLDGLAAGISGIAALTFVVIGVGMKGSLGEAILAAGLVGVCLGFLRYNFHPARIFMGDAGSHFLGFTIAALSILQNWKVATAISFTIPVLVLAVPIFDAGFAVVRRLLGQKPIFSADKGHLHHRLLNLGLDQRSVVFTIYIITALGCVLALCLAQARMWPGLKETTHALHHISRHRYAPGGRENGAGRTGAAADDAFTVKVVLTAQHREMLDQVMRQFGLPAMSIWISCSRARRSRRSPCARLRGLEHTMPHIARTSCWRRGIPPRCSPRRWPPFTRAFPSGTWKPDCVPAINTHHIPRR